MAKSLDEYMAMATAELGPVPEEGVVETPEGVPSLDSLVRQSNIELGYDKKGPWETLEDTAANGLLEMGKRLPGLWEHLGHQAQEKKRQFDYFAYNDPMEEPASVVWRTLMTPKRMWTKAERDRYDNWKKDKPLAIQQEQDLTNLIFRAPKEFVGKQIKNYYALHPDAQREEMDSFMDGIKNPRKIVSAAGEALPLMVGSGVAMVFGQAPLAAAIMFGAEGETAYESAKEYLIEQGMEPNQADDEARDMFNLYGFISAAIEMFQISHFMKLTGLQRKALVGVLARKAAKGEIKSMSWSAIKTQIGEALEEMTQGATEEGLAKVLYNKPIEGGKAGWIDRRAQEGLVAAAIGAPFVASGLSIDLVSGGGVYNRSSQQVRQDRDNLARTVEFFKEQATQTVENVAAEGEAEDAKGGFLEEEDYDVPQILTRQHQKIEEVVERIFGKKVTWFSPRTQEGADFDGIVDPLDSDRILLNSESSRPLKNISLHETVHQVRNKRPEQYNVLRNTVFEFLRANEYLLEEVRGISKRKRNLTEDEVTEEVVAEVIGRLGQEDAFWDRISQQNPSVLTKLKQAGNRRAEELD
jgi:hypothetical protein